MLGLHCCIRLSLVVVGRGCSLVAVCGLLLLRLPGSRAHRLGGCGTWAQKLPCKWNLPRLGTPVPCIGRQILNHWTTREIHTIFCVILFFSSQCVCLPFLCSAFYTFPKNICLSTWSHILVIFNGCLYNLILP